MQKSTEKESCDKRETRGFRAIRSVRKKCQLGAINRFDWLALSLYTIRQPIAVRAEHAAILRLAVSQIRARVKTNSGPEMFNLSQFSYHFFLRIAIKFDVSLSQFLHITDKITKY